MSTANKPPLFDELPPRMVVPAIVVGAQSLKPGFTVNFSVGAVLSGWTGVESDCASTSTAQTAAPAAAPPARHTNSRNAISIVCLSSCVAA